MPNTTVLYFSHLRRQLALESEPVELPAQASAQEILALIARHHPEAAELIESSRLAVDQEFVGGHVHLREGAEVAVITPVSGG